MLFQQSDSLNNASTISIPEETEPHVSKPQHPYQVLRQLPADATPAQQDSAIQAVFQPKEVHYSSRPDTLHLPGQDAGKGLNDVTLPKYYKESFFSKDSLFHPELSGGRYGVAGDPVPYSIHGDNFVTGMLLGCFILALIAFSQSRSFLFRQAKDFFYTKRSGTTEVSETSAELRFQFFLVLQTCLLLALLYFFYTTIYIADTFVLSSQYQLIAIYFGIIASYFLVKTILYTLVNNVFFDNKKNVQWLKAQIFLTSAEGVALFPFVMLHAYFDLSIKNTLIYFAVVVIFVKLLSFYKCYSIFFRKIGAFLQIILYFCALEITPLIALLVSLVMTGNYLKINF
jgi:hypothetical protein